MDYEQILSRFQVKKRAGNRAMCRCPAHDDREASLSVSEAGDGRTLVHCFAGCETERVLSQAGLKWADLYPDREAGEDRWIRYVEKREGRQVEAVYDYLDPATGEYRFTRLRLCGKGFAYGVLSGGRFRYGLEGKGRRGLPAVFTGSLSRLRETAARGGRVYYAEGEKDVLALEARGLPAFTCGACGDWDPACAELARGADAVICADYDEPGRRLAERVRRDLEGVAARARVLYPDRSAPGRDVSDYFDAGHTARDLERLAEAGADGGERGPEPPEAPAPNEEGGGRDLNPFHLFNEKGKIVGVYDMAIYREIVANESLFVLGGVPYIYRSGVYLPDEGGKELKTRIRALIWPEHVKSTVVTRVYDLFLQASELHVTFEGLNAYPAHWINFRNGFYDPVERRMIPHDPAYRAVNQLPHAFDPEAEAPGPAVEEWLRFIAPDAQDREMLLQYLGYCMTRDCRQQKFLILCGMGGTGKSTLIRLVERMIGRENAGSVSMTELTQRFGAFGLLGRLVNCCADLEIGALEDTSLLKKALGEDTLRCERKGQDAFSFRSYARMVFSTNELPLVRSERTNGFYRRMLVLTMNRVPREARPDLSDALEREIDAFIRLCADAVGRMYAAGRIAESASSREAVERLWCESDTVEAFLRDETRQGPPDRRVRRTALFGRYDQYCRDSDRQPLSRCGLFRALRAKGYGEAVIHGERYITGLSLPDRDRLPPGAVPVPVTREELPFD